MDDFSDQCQAIRGSNSNQIIHLTPTSSMFAHVLNSLHLFLGQVYPRKGMYFFSIVFNFSALNTVRRGRFQFGFKDDRVEQCLRSYGSEFQM